jgi:integrase
MAIRQWADRRGVARVVLSKYWPDGSRFRRYYQNKTLARKVLARIDEAIAMGTWRELKRELTEGTAQPLTVATFYEQFRDQWCKVRMRSWKRYDLSFQSINRIVGHIPLHDFRRRHLHDYIDVRTRELSKKDPGRPVAAATVNRDIAALKSMFTYALEQNAIELHPLARFRLLPTQEVEIRVPTQEEYRRLVTELEAVDPVVAALAAVLGETAVRYREALSLTRTAVDRRSMMLTVTGRTKSRKVRHIPLSDCAIQWIDTLTPYASEPRLFVNPRSGTAWVNPEKIWRAAARAAGTPWLNRHMLRHFRISEWVRRGIDLRTVQQYAGHANIETTMRYAHFAPSRGAAAMREAQAAEREEMA